MADVALLASATQDAGGGYQVPGAQEIILKCLTASYDGASAAGNFVPAVQIIAPNGAVMGTFPVASTVTAGSSVDVSWFRGVGGSGSGGGSVGGWQYATPVAPASAQPEWVAGAAFQNSWLNVQLADGSYNPLRYRTVQSGVQVVGAITGGALGTTVLVMPAGYVPPFDAEGIVGSAVGTATFTVAVNASTGTMNVVGGGGPAVIVARGTFGATVQTTGTTYATGADILAAPLSFLADGSSDYRVSLSATGYAVVSASLNDLLIHLNLDGSDAGLCTEASSSGPTQPAVAYAYIGSPAAGVHTVNLRLVAFSSSPAVQVVASATLPGLITVERLP